MDELSIRNHSRAVVAQLDRATGFEHPGLKRPPATNPDKSTTYGDRRVVVAPGFDTFRLLQDVKLDVSQMGWPANVLERFWSKVDVGDPSECWEWKGARCHKREDYGYLSLRQKGTRTCRKLLAHRLSFVIHHGPIPDKWVVRHRCDNPACVNPHHLELGTHADNMRDMAERGRSTRGERNHHAKLTRERVSQIKRRCSEGATLKVIASEFDVHLSTVGLIRQGKIWADVEVGQ